MLNPETAHDLARAVDAERRRAAAARHRRDTPRRPRSVALREAVGYRLVITGWRLLDGARAGAVSGVAGPPAPTGGPKPA
jgi:hypothetical protein